MTDDKLKVFESKSSNKKSPNNKHKKDLSSTAKQIENFFSPKESKVLSDAAFTTVCIDNSSANESKTKQTPQLKINETRYLTNEEKKLVAPQDADLQMSRLKRDKYVQTEKAFLAKSSFKIRNDDLDEQGHQLLDKFKSLQAQSVDPMHLTILHDSFASRLSQLLYDKIFTKQSSQDKNVFIEYNPGFGLVSRKLMERKELVTGASDYKQKFVLIEPLGKFENSLKELKDKFEDKYDISLLKANPFLESFMFKSNKFKYSFIKAISEIEPATTHIPSVKVKDNDTHG